MVVAILRCVTIHTGINTDNKLKTTHTPKTNTNKAGCNNKPPSRLIPDNSTSPLPNNHTRPSQTKTHENRYPKIPPKKTVSRFYNPQIKISAESETKRSIFREKDKTKRSKKESAQHSKSRNKSFVMTSVSAL